jgi:hypothetical protein
MTHAIHFKYEHPNPKLFVPTCGLWQYRFQSVVNPPYLTTDLSKVTCRMCLRSLGLLKYPEGAQAHSKMRIKKSLTDLVVDSLRRDLGPDNDACEEMARRAIAVVRRWDKVHGRTL